MAISILDRAVTWTFQVPSTRSTRHEHAAGSTLLVSAHRDQSYKVCTLQGIGKREGGRLFADAPVHIEKTSTSCKTEPGALGAVCSRIQLPCHWQGLCFRLVILHAISSRKEHRERSIPLCKDATLPGEKRLWKRFRVHVLDRRADIDDCFLDDERGVKTCYARSVCVCGKITSLVMRSRLRSDGLVPFGTCTCSDPSGTTLYWSECCGLLTRALHLECSTSFAELLASQNPAKGECLLTTSRKSPASRGRNEEAFWMG